MDKSTDVILVLNATILSQESLLHEMWEELKFAVDWSAGDTKPIKPDSRRSASR